MEFDFDVRKSLLELEPDAWAPESLEEGLIPIAQRCAHKPLRRLSPAELRELILRGLGLRYTVPLAIDVLEDAPFFEAQLYPGDLLVALLEADTRFWLAHEDLWLAVIPLLAEAIGIIQGRVEAEERADYLPWHLGDDFMAALIHFRGIHQGNETS
jgi:hypothetical protein